MWPTRVYCGIHRGDWQKFWWKIQGEPQGPPPIFDYFQSTGHLIKLEKFSRLDRESQGITKAIKRAMYIRNNDLPLNGNLGKYQLPNIWDGVLQVMLAFHLQWPCTPSTPQTTVGYLPNKMGHKLLPWGKYGPPRCVSSLHLSPHPTFGAIFFPTELVSITFSLRSEEVFLALTSQKLVWIHV